MWSKKLIWQIYRAFLLIIVIPALLFIWYTTRTFRNFFIDRTITSLTEKAYQLSSHIAGYSLTGDAAAIDSLCKYHSETVATRFTVIAADGKVAGDSEKDPDSMENHTNRMEVIAALAGKIGISDRFSYTLDQEMLYVAVPVRQHGAISGVVRAALSIENVHAELRKIYLRMGVGYSIVALIAALVSYLLSRRISRPIDAMKQGAQRFAAGDFTGKLMPSGCDEIDRLSEVLNDMALRLRDTIDKLREQHNRLDAVLSSMTEGVIALDSQQCIIAVNNAAVNLFELEAKPQDGTWIGEVLRNAKINQFLKRIEERGGNVDDETSLSLPLKSGVTAERLLQLHGNALKDAAGATIGGLVVINDVTRMRKLETMRSDFVANVSHELRTPLTSIKGFVETLLAGAIDDREEALHFLQIIARQVDRLSTIVADLLALSRIEQEGRAHGPQLQEVKIDDLLGRVMESCGAKAAKKGITIVAQIPPGMTGLLEPALVEEALVNLVDNATNYSPDGSRVVVAAAVDREKKELTLSVTDNGPGIAPEHHERIFERFYRVDKARSRKLGGTGLGLSIVKHIALAHNGRVSVQSAPGTGSTFFIHLPGHDDTTKEKTA